MMTFSLNYDNTHANENNFVELLRNKFIRFKSTNFTDYIVTKNKISLIYKVLHSFYENDANKKSHSGNLHHHQ